MTARSDVQFVCLYFAVWRKLLTKAMAMAMMRDYVYFQPDLG